MHDSTVRVVMHATSLLRFRQVDPLAYLYKHAWAHPRLCKETGGMQRYRDGSSVGYAETLSDLSTVLDCV